MSRAIDYGNLMHRAMRGLIQQVLEGVAKDGLPGQHHFFITFDTMHPDVELADWLSDRYPEGFSITLNFGDNPEPLYIPYDAIKTFVDPSVEFGLRFETQESADEDDQPDDEDSDDDAAEDHAKKEAEVVRLDSFRK